MNEVGHKLHVSDAVLFQIPASHLIASAQATQILVKLLVQTLSDATLFHATCSEVVKSMARKWKLPDETHKSLQEI